MENEIVLQKFQKKKYLHLITSITLDVLGMVTYLIPFLGEIGDVIYAPLYGLAIFIMYKKSIFTAALGGITGTIEELLPGADAMPTATIMWIYTYVFRKNKALADYAKDKNKEIDALKELK